ncbi:MAG TPA: S9 family peptidase, partial [Proteiniphilum sp.]|nr:S9 family peptidase [Proteiniphilum sp.]
MNKRFSTILLILLLLGGTVVAQITFSPAEVSTFGPVKVQTPVLLDSVNLSDKPYSDELLLSTIINFPAPEKYTGKLQADTAGFFTLPKPEEGKAF